MNNELEKFDNDKSGFSLLINFYDKKILFDFGINNEVKINLQKIGLSEDDIDVLALSHGHIDHSDGLRYLDFKKRKDLICHPNALDEKFFGEESIGCPLKPEELNEKFNLIYSKKPYWIIENKIAFLGEIPREQSLSENEFPGKLSNGETDFCVDDSAIAINTSKGIVLVVGCSHSGIENIISYAKNILNNNKIYSIIGGMHILNKERLEEVTNFLDNEKIDKIYPLHCFNEEAINKIGKRAKTLEKFIFN